MRKRLAIGSIVSRFVRLWYSVLATWPSYCFYWSVLWCYTRGHGRLTQVDVGNLGIPVSRQKNAYNSDTGYVNRICFCITDSNIII